MSEPRASRPWVATAGPHVKLSIDKFDFGSVPPGTTVNGQIVIESVGDAALQVSRIGVQCECASGRPPRRTCTKPSLAPCSFSNRSL